jgi:hypothetical protein
MSRARGFAETCSTSATMNPAGTERTGACSATVQPPRLHLPLDEERQLLAQEEVLGCEAVVRGTRQRYEVQQITNEQERRANHSARSMILADRRRRSGRSVRLRSRQHSVRGPRWLRRIFAEHTPRLPHQSSPKNSSLTWFCQTARDGDGTTWPAQMDFSVGTSARGGGHLPKGEYDVQTDGRDRQAPAAPAVR